MCLDSANDALHSQHTPFSIEQEHVLGPSCTHITIERCIICARRSVNKETSDSTFALPQLLIWYCVVMMEAVNTSESSVDFCKTTGRNISQDSHLYNTIVQVKSENMEILRHTSHKRSFYNNFADMIDSLRNIYGKYCWFAYAAITPSVQTGITYIFITEEYLSFLVCKSSSSVVLQCL
jgi:hypothetical protein